MAKATERIEIARIEIARIEQKTTADALGIFAMAMLVLGVIPTFVAFLVETSAVRLAAWAALWTGYNVFWGVLVLYGQRTVMAVTRAAPATEEHD